MRPGFFSSISAMRGSTSRRMKSSAVSLHEALLVGEHLGREDRALPVGSSRNPPPGTEGQRVHRTGQSGIELGIV